MYKAIKGGSFELVYNDYVCHLPPVPPDHEILFNTLPKADQYWRREPVPEAFTDLFREESAIREEEKKLVDLGQKKKVTYVNPVLEKYRRREFFRRRWGVWFYNNGRPTYITGHHYLYLQWYLSDNGYPNYYEFSRKAFYFRQYSEEDPFALGYMIIGPRGTGKSQEEMACILNNMTVRHHATAVLQSKNFDKDAKGVLFQTKARLAFNNLPAFFKPVHSHGSQPQNGFDFTRDAVKGEGAKAVQYGDEFELDSFIFPVLPGDDALDGDTIAEIFEDEIGKCILPETRVLTYSGLIKRADEVSIGDRLMGINSEPRKILEIKTGRDKAFRIKPKKSGWDAFSCSSGHKLALKWSSARPLNYRGKLYPKGETVVMTIDSFLSLNKTQKKHLTLFRVPVNYQEKRVFLDPYLLGLWLGDGDSRRMTITSIEPEIVNNLYSHGFKVTKENNDQRTARYHIHGQKALLRGYNLLRNKHIPMDYMVTSTRARLALLAGLIDTDGHSNISGNRMNAEIVQKNERLAKDIKRLAIELGFNCSLVTKTATMKRSDGSMYSCEVYRLFIFGELWQIPLLVARKQFSRVAEHHVNRKNPIHCGFTVEELPDQQEYVGFVLDGDKLHLLGDCQVTHNTDPTIADVTERHKVNVKAVWRNHTKIGLMRKTSTVEKMTSGGTQCHALWKESDPKKRDANGQTVSKLNRMFISALDTDTTTKEIRLPDGQTIPPACDRYGFVDRQIANRKIQAALDLIKHDYVAMSSEMRKNPRHEGEAFIPDQSQSIFNIQKLTDRLNYLRNTLTKPLYTRGNLYWLKEKFGPVGFAADAHAGRFNWAWFPDEFLDKSRPPDQWKVLNNFGEEWGYDPRGQSRMLKFPRNDHLFRLATDPIKYSKTKDPRASKCAIHGFRLMDVNLDYGLPNAKWKSHNFIFEYCERPEDPETCLEDMAMVCLFLGARILPERNIPAANEYFEQNGLHRFLTYPRDMIMSTMGDIQINSDDAGYASTPEVIDAYTRRLIKFINEHIDRFVFDNTIEDWMGFDSTNPTKSHMTVSSGFTLIHAERVGEKQENETEDRANNWFDVADNSGVTGRWLDEDELEEQQMQRTRMSA